LLRVSTAPLLTRQQIAIRAGVSDDVMSFWLKNGVLRACEDSGGRGHHRRFAFYELNIAAIAEQLRRHGANVESLRSLSNTFREAIDRAAESRLEYDDWEEVGSYVKRGYRIPSSSITDRDIRIAKQIRSECLDYDQITRYMMISRTILDRPDRLDQSVNHTFFWRRADGSWEVTADPSTETFTNIAIDLERLFYQVWHPGDDGRPLNFLNTEPASRYKIWTRKDDKNPSGSVRSQTRGAPE
jgi:hypothetical protein